MKHNVVDLEEMEGILGMDEELEGVLASLMDQKIEYLESMESAAALTASPTSTSTEIVSTMTEDAATDKALPTAPDIDDQAFSAISGSSGLSEGVVTGPSMEVDKLGPISAPKIILPTLLVSWAEYQPTSTEVLAIPHIDEHSTIPISEEPNPPSTTLWLQPFLHEAAMAAHRIHQEEIVRSSHIHVPDWRAFNDKHAMWSTITHAERFDDKFIGLKQETGHSDGIVSFIPDISIPVNSVQEDDKSSSDGSDSSDSSSAFAITEADHSSSPWSNAINCSYSQDMRITSLMVSLESIWPHASPSEDQRMPGANLTEGDLYCTENIDTSVHRVGESHRRPSNSSLAIFIDTEYLANTGNRADDYIHQGNITCSSSETPYCGRDLHGNSSPRFNKRPYSHIISTTSAMIPEGLSSPSSSSPSGNISVGDENLNPAHRPPRAYSRRRLPKGMSSSYAHVMRISSISTVSSGEHPTTPPTPENIGWSIRSTNAFTPGERMHWILDLCPSQVELNPDEVNNALVWNALTPILEAEDMGRRLISGKGLEVYDRPVFEFWTIPADISQMYIQQHHKSEVDTSVFQFSPQEEEFAHQNFPKEAVDYDEEPEQFTFLHWEDELAEVLGMPEPQQDLLEVLMKDINMGWILDCEDVDEIDLAFNNTEFFGVTQSEDST